MAGGSLKNLVIATLVPLPSILFYLSFVRAGADDAGPISSWCAAHPLVLANALFFLNVNVLFWLLGLILSNHWVTEHPNFPPPLRCGRAAFRRFAPPRPRRVRRNADSVVSLQLIDLYWTVIPVLLLHYYRGHPASEADAARSAAAVALTWLWSARLTHNYLRREGWELGRREDWRFNEMRAQYGTAWWWMSFVAVYLSQQVLYLYVPIINTVFSRILNRAARRIDSILWPDEE
jgi:hypothetical protein